MGSTEWNIRAINTPESLGGYTWKLSPKKWHHAQRFKLTFKHVQFRFDQLPRGKVAQVFHIEGDTSRWRDSEHGLLKVVYDPHKEEFMIYNGKCTYTIDGLAASLKKHGGTNLSFWFKGEYTLEVTNDADPGFHFKKNACALAVLKKHHGIYIGTRHADAQAGMVPFPMKVWDGIYLQVGRHKKDFLIGSRQVDPSGITTVGGYTWTRQRNTSHSPNDVDVNISENATNIFPAAAKGSGYTMFGDTKHKTIAFSTDAIDKKFGLAFPTVATTKIAGRDFSDCNNVSIDPSPLYTSAIRVQGMKDKYISQSGLQGSASATSQYSLHGPGMVTSAYNLRVTHRPQQWLMSVWFKQNKRLQGTCTAFQVTNSFHSMSATPINVHLDAPNHRIAVDGAGSTATGVDIALTQAVPLKAWVHLCVAYDIVTRTRVLYVNGMRVKTLNDVTTPLLWNDRSQVTDSVTVDVKVGVLDTPSDDVSIDVPALLYGLDMSTPAKLDAVATQLYTTQTSQKAAKATVASLAAKDLVCLLGDAQAPAVDMPLKPSSGNAGLDPTDPANTFALVTPAEAVAPRKTWTEQDGFHTPLFQDKKRRSQTPSVPRPLTVPQVFVVPTKALLKTFIASIDKALVVTRCNPPKLYFMFVNGYMYPLDARPILEIGDAPTPPNSTIQRSVQFDFPALATEWNLRELQFRGVAKHSKILVEVFPSASRVMTGCRLWFNPTLTQSDMYFSSGSADVPVQTHYNNKVQSAPMASKTSAVSGAAARIPGGRKLSFEYMSSTANTPVGAWITYAHPSELKA